MRLTAVFILIILSVILTGVISPLLFGFMEHGNNHFCPISSLFEKNCLSLNDIFSSIIYHISSWQKIFQAIVNFNPILSALILTTFFALIFKKLFKLSHNKSRLYYQRYLTINEKLFESLKRFFQWFALFNSYL